MPGYLEKGIQTPMAQGRSNTIILTIKWIRTSRLSITNSFFCHQANTQNTGASFRVEEHVVEREGEARAVQEVPGERAFFIDNLLQYSKS